jgi:Domain of unknown function (DUF6438)/Ankyrin repeats (many copies)
MTSPNAIGSFTSGPRAKLAPLLVSPLVVLSILTGCNRLSHPKNLASLSITLSRTPCQVFCPVYSVMLRGTGEVDYEGIQGVPVRGRRSAMISQEKVAAILLEVENARFMTLDDKTFIRLPHGGEVVILVSIDGQNKIVSSPDIEGGFSRPPEDLKKEFSNKQVRFVKLADKIDSLIGTERWTKCSLNCTKLLYAIALMHSLDARPCPNLLEVIQSDKPLTYGSLVCDSQTLIEAGFDVNAPDQRGVTPLMAAAKNGDAALVRNLLAHGAIPGTKDNKGRTALDYCKDSQIRRLLTGDG